MYSNFGSKTPAATMIEFGGKLDVIMTSLESFMVRLDRLESTGVSPSVSNSARKVADRLDLMYGLISRMDERLGKLETRLTSQDNNFKEVLNAIASSHSDMKEAIDKMASSVEKCVSASEANKVVPVSAVAPTTKVSSQVMQDSMSDFEIWPESRDSLNTSGADAELWQTVPTLTATSQEPWQQVADSYRVAEEPLNLAQTDEKGAVASNSMVISEDHDDSVSRLVMVTRRYKRQELLDLRVASSQLAAPKEIPKRILKGANGPETQNKQPRHNRSKSSTPNSRESLRPKPNPPEAREVKLSPEFEICREVNFLLTKVDEDTVESIGTHFGIILSDEGGLITIAEDKLALVEKVVGIIFKKAVSEPNRAKIFAKLCVMLNKIEVGGKDGKKGVTFKKVLVDQCQKGFEDCLYNCSSQDDNKYLGYVSLTSALYLMGELTVEFVIYTIYCLLWKKENTTLEATCKLLGEIGGQFEGQLLKVNNQEQTTWWHSTLTFLEGIVKEKKASPRVCAMILDVLKGQKEHWRVPSSGRVAKPQGIWSDGSDDE